MIVPNLSNLSANQARAIRAAVATLAVTATVLTGIALREDWRGDAYIPVKGDVPTIGFGSTKGVRMGDKITVARSLVRLNDEVEGVYASALKKCITAPLHMHEFGALVMLAYNVGAPTVCRKAEPGKPPNLIDLVNAGRYEEACERIKAFNRGPSPGKDAAGRKIPGPVMAGLVNARAVESAMCRGEV